MAENNPETPLALRIKDTLSAIFGQMPLVTLGRCAQVSKLWKDVTDHCILLELNLGDGYLYASNAMKKFQHAKKIRLPKQLYNYKKGEEHIFFTEIYPKGVKNLTALSLPPGSDFFFRDDSAREELAHLFLDPLPNSCVHFDYVNFWPEFFNIIDKNHSKNLKSLGVLLNTGGKISAPWNSFYSLIKNSTQLESLGLHYFDNTRFEKGNPNFDVLSANLTHVLHLATQLQHLNIPHRFNIDSIVQEMPLMPHLTYLYIQETMTNTPPNTLLEKCSKLQFLHLMIENHPSQYQISSNSLRTLLIDSRSNLNEITIECPNLEVLKFLAPRQIKEVHIAGPHKLNEFTSKAQFVDGLHGNFDSVKITDHQIFARINTTANIEELTIECEAPQTQAVYDSINSLTQLTNLKSLTLIKVKRLEDVQISIFSQLTKLVLKKCDIKGNEFNFNNLPNLKDLQMIYSEEIKSIKISECQQLSNLVVFSHSQLRTIEIKDSLNIEHVDIRNCALNLSSWRQLEKLPKMVNLLATIIPMSSYLKIMEQNPIISISGKKVLDRVYSGSVSMINTRLDWKTKEEYDESGPNILIRKCF